MEHFTFPRSFGSCKCLRAVIHIAFISVTGYAPVNTFFFKQKTAYEIMSGDWSSDVCSSD
eukprot:COSAG06_NODE_52760_length_304_cov_0.473171_1_plen_59_part_10